MFRWLVFATCLGIVWAVSDSSECAPSSQYVPDIPCLNASNSAIQKDMPFCGEFITYQIDQRLDYEKLDKLALHQLTQFNETNDKATNECFKYRKVLTCALAFPICSDEPYVGFPCRDVCYRYYNNCGGDNSTCVIFPTADCTPLELLVPTVNGGSMLHPLPMIVTFFIISIVMAMFI